MAGRSGEDGDLQETPENGVRTGLKTRPYECVAWLVAGGLLVDAPSNAYVDLDIEFSGLDRRGLAGGGRCHPGGAVVVHGRGVSGLGDTDGIADIDPRGVGQRF